MCPSYDRGAHHAVTNRISKRHTNSHPRHFAVSNAAKRQSYIATSKCFTRRSPAKDFSLDARKGSLWMRAEAKRPPTTRTRHPASRPLKKVEMRGARERTR